MNAAAAAGESAGMKIKLPRSRWTRRICAKVLGAVLVTAVAVTSFHAYKKQRAIAALHGSGFVMARMLPGSRWFGDSLRGPWVDAVELSGWLPGPHIVARVGAHPRTVTWEALETLVELQNAQTLYLERCGLTDEQLALVSQVRGLKVLHIDGNPITDKGLQHLTSLSSLEVLIVADTSVTAAGVERFRQSMPHCEVVIHKTPEFFDSQPVSGEKPISCY